MSKPPQCSVCACTFETGCMREGRPKRKYVMKQPRAKRGPSKTATEKGIAKLRERASRVADIQGGEIGRAHV